LTAPGTMAAPTVQAMQDHPVLAFASSFTCPDDLAEGVLAKNDQEKLWDSHGLFHVIERSNRCSPERMTKLRGCYCTCSR
jgi:hypothetical protein